jgi:hypothetical protein
VSIQRTIPEITWVFEQNDAVTTTTTNPTTPVPYYKCYRVGYNDKKEYGSIFIEQTNRYNDNTLIGGYQNTFADCYNECKKATNCKYFTLSSPDDLELPENSTKRGQCSMVVSDKDYRSSELCFGQQGVKEDGRIFETVGITYHMSPPPASANPSTTFANPSTTFANPSTTYANPTTTFANPSTTFANPTRTYANPTTTFANPTTTFANPTTTFANPTTTFANPSTTYANPTTTFANPTTTYANPSTTTFANPSTTYANPSTTTFANPSTTYANPSTTYANPSTTYANPSTTYANPTTTYANPTTTAYTTPSPTETTYDSQQDQYNNKYEPKRTPYMPPTSTTYQEVPSPVLTVSSLNAADSSNPDIYDYTYKNPDGIHVVQSDYEGVGNIYIPIMSS